MENLILVAMCVLGASYVTKFFLIGHQAPAIGKGYVWLPDKEEGFKYSLEYSIADWVRSFFIRYIGEDGNYSIASPHEEKSLIRRNFYQIFNCSFCLGFWVSIPFSLYLSTQLGIPLPIIHLGLSMAVSKVVD